MVEKLKVRGKSHDAGSLEETRGPRSKAMSESVVHRQQNESTTNGDDEDDDIEGDSESGTTHAEGESEEEGNDEKDVSPEPKSSFESVSKSKGKRGEGSLKKGVYSAKVENGKIVQMGTSSESSIKTTPDSSLETNSLNVEGPEGGKGRDNNGRVVVVSSLSPQKLSSGSNASTKKRGRDSSSPAAGVESKSKDEDRSGGSNNNNNVDSLGSNNSIDRSTLNIRALPFESGVNTECIQLLRQLWNVHDEALHFLNGVHKALNTFRRWLRMEDNEHESSLWDKKRSSSSSAVSQRPRMFALKGEPPDAASDGGEVGNDIRWVPLQPFIDGLKCVSDNVSDIEKQCLTLSVFQSQCKLVLYAKIRHAKRQVAHDRLAILHGVHQLVLVTTQLLASPSFWLSTEVDVVSSYAFSVFHLSETYNACLESCWTQVEQSLAAANPSLCSTPSEADSGSDRGTTVSLSKIRVLTQVKAANTNDAPLLKQSLKPLTATKLLQVISQRRAMFCSFEFTRTTLTAFYEESGGGGTGDATRAVEKLTQYLEDESIHLSTFEKAFSKRPSLLGRAAVKESENGEFRLTKSFKLKMYGYFHEVLWSLVGEYSEDLILWSLLAAIPLTLQPGETQIALRRQLMLWSHAQAKNPTPLLPAFEAIAEALHSFSLMVNWDEKMRDAFELTYKVKRPEHVNLIPQPGPSEMATDVGKNFGEILSSCIALMESGNSISNRMTLPPEERQKLASLFGEEEPLGDEAQILFRLEATLNYFRAWTVRRAKVWLNAWAVPQFIAASQREPAILVQLIKSKEVFLITRDALLKSENVAMRISARNRQMCADDMKNAIQSLQRVPDELLVAVGIVCRTLSLATLQTYMPAANHWRGSGKGSGLDPDRPSPYVKIFIDRVVEPVFKAAVKLVPPLVQESLGKQTINAMCDAWLHFILQRKIKFSEWGAVQLLRDFVSLREWIKNETPELDKDARKAILQLEILKSCEGVAYLLLRNPGDVLGVGKPSRKSRRVAPASNESSPSHSEEGSSAEDAIPPEMYVPNQQMWLQLRLKKSAFPTCCNF